VRKLKIIEHISLDGVIQASADAPTHRATPTSTIPPTHRRGIDFP
jgi:hypothetical protein